MKSDNKIKPISRRGIIVTVTGALVGIALILVTVELIHRNVIPFIVTRQRYIISVEVVMLGFFLTEMIARVSSYSLRAPERKHINTSFRLTIRIIGYLVVLVSVISILASNPTLGISMGAIAGVVIAFATQNVIGNVLAAILIINTRLVRIGEEVTVAGIKGTVADIRLSHTVIHVDDDVVYVPNTVMVSTALRRKKRPGTDDQPS